MSQVKSGAFQRGCQLGQLGVSGEKVGEEMIAASSFLVVLKKSEGEEEYIYDLKCILECPFVDGTFQRYWAECMVSTFRGLSHEP